MWGSGGFVGDGEPATGSAPGRPAAAIGLAGQGSAGLRNGTSSGWQSTWSTVSRTSPFDLGTRSNGSLDTKIRQSSSPITAPLQSLTAVVPTPASVASHSPPADGMEIRTADEGTAGIDSAAHRNISHHIISRSPSRTWQGEWGVGESWSSKFIVGLSPRPQRHDAEQTSTFGDWPTTDSHVPTVPLRSGTSSCMRSGRSLSTWTLAELGSDASDRRH
jgi:hypothetical protein